MLKAIFFSLLVCSLSFAVNSDQNQTKKQELKWSKSKTPFVSKKEVAYQKYKKNLEAENRKLEEDGFCSCNNN